MTVKQTISAVRALGCSCIRTWHNEFRVNLPEARGGSEATAYYTEDAEDAIDTARAMLARA